MLLILCPIVLLSPPPAIHTHLIVPLFICWSESASRKKKMSDDLPNRRKSEQQSKCNIIES